MTLSDPLPAIAGLALVGLLLWWLALRRLRRQRPLSATCCGLGGSTMLSLAALAAALVINLQTYHRLTYEQPVAELRFEARAPQHYQVHLRTTDARERVVELRGDQWQLDARVLKWRGVANLLGLDARYRLERLSGRYRDIEQTRTGPQSAVALFAADAGPDLLSLAGRLPRWAALVDAEYGSATYLPMADGAAFTVALSQSGLLARPANEAAREATRRW